jgi:hypothetical protein
MIEADATNSSFPGMEQAAVCASGTAQVPFTHRLSQGAVDGHLVQ